MPILLPDPVLLPLSAAALRSAAVTFSSLAASISTLSPSFPVVGVFADAGRIRQQ